MALVRSDKLGDSNARMYMNGHNVSAYAVKDGRPHATCTRLEHSAKRGSAHVLDIAKHYTRYTASLSNSYTQISESSASCRAVYYWTAQSWRPHAHAS